MLGLRTSEVNQAKRVQCIVAITDADGWAVDLLHDRWDVLHPEGVVCKASAVKAQLQSIAGVARFGETEVDPLLLPLMSVTRSPWRSMEGFGRLVQHAWACGATDACADVCAACGACGLG